jgi:hypothetical protein
MGSRHVSQFWANSKLKLSLYIYIYKKKFLILYFFKKFSSLNAIMTINAIMRKKKSLYFGLMNIHTYDIFIKHNKLIKIMTKPVQPLKFTGFLLKRPI